MEKKEIKITKKLLDGHRKRKMDIPLLELELQEMQEGDNGIGISTILNGQYWPPKPEGVAGFDWDLYERRKKNIDQKKAQVKAVETWINEIEDGRTRCVFKMFYVDGLTWERIAAKTGYSESLDYPRLYIRDKYLKKCHIT